jgi:hypothetical protein
MIVEQAIIEREMQIMARPLGQSEFTFALNLNTKSHSRKNNIKRSGDTVFQQEGRSSGYGACSGHYDPFSKTRNDHSGHDNSDSRFQKTIFLPSVTESILENQSEFSSKVSA